jgi:hypothetical protein
LNAASAEESASASREMTLQAEKVRDIVQDLGNMVSASQQGPLDGDQQGGRKSFCRMETAAKAPDTILLSLANFAGRVVALSFESELV